jgi:hypothetical protein
MIMEPLMATAAEADRHAQGGPQRRVPADRSKAAGVDQDRPQQCASVASICHVAAQSAALCMWRAVWL